LSYRPAGLEIDSWAPQKVYKFELSPTAEKVIEVAAPERSYTRGDKTRNLGLTQLYIEHGYILGGKAVSETTNR
jgi:hypothetical protein